MLEANITPITSFFFITHLPALFRVLTPRSVDTHQLGTMATPTEEKAMSSHKESIIPQQTHVEEKYDEEPNAYKNELAEVHEGLEKERMLWQNLKLYRSVRPSFFPLSTH